MGKAWTSDEVERGIRTWFETHAAEVQKEIAISLLVTTTPDSVQGAVLLAHMAHEALMEDSSRLEFGAEYGLGTDEPQVDIILKLSEGKGIKFLGGLRSDGEAYAWAFIPKTDRKVAKEKYDRVFAGSTS